MGENRLAASAFLRGGECALWPTLCAGAQQSMLGQGILPIRGHFGVARSIAATTSEHVPEVSTLFPPQYILEAVFANEVPKGLQNLEA